MIFDLIVVFAYFALILWIGLCRGKKDESLEEFALAHRRIPWWAVLGSIIAAETSAGTFLGTPGEGYVLKNFTYLQLFFGSMLGRFVVGATFLKTFYKFNVYSIYEFLEVRFGPKTKSAASIVFLVTRTLASGTRLYIAAVILVLAYKLAVGPVLAPAQELWLYVLAITLITAITAIYTTLGGIQAVIWTDLLQASVLVGCGLLAAGILYFRIPGGISEIRAAVGSMPLWSSGTSAGFGLGQNIRQVLSSDYTVFAAFVGSTFTTMATHGTDQDLVQRMLTSHDAGKSQRSLWASGIAELPIVFLYLAIGILLFVFYQKYPDPRLPAKTNEIFAHFILTQLPSGVRGLLIAGIFATAMGSLSSALNALATSFTRDWYLPHLKPQATEHQIFRVAQRSTLVFALLMIVVASLTSYAVILYPQSRIIPIVLGVFGYTYGSLLGVFLLGMWTRTRGSDFGNGLAMLAGFIAVAVLSDLPTDLGRVFGISVHLRPQALPWISFPWRVFVGTLVTTSVAACFRKTDLKS